MPQNITTDQPYFLMGWAASRLGMEHIWPAETVPIAAVDDDGTVQAVVLYNAFYDNSCCMHIATAKTRRWATRATLRAFFEYPFNRLGLLRVQTMTPSHNIEGQILALKLGFKIEGIKRTAEGDTEVMFGMQRNECRHLPIEPQKTDAHDAALQPEQREAKDHGQEIISS